MLARCLSVFLFLATPLVAQVQTTVGAFQDSAFVAQYTSEFDRLTVLVSDGQGYVPRVEEGELRATVFKAPEGKSIVEVVRNFEIALEDAGFTFLFNRPLLRKRFDTPEGSALRYWVTELRDAHATRGYSSESGRTGKIELDNIYIFPDHYLSAEREKDGVLTVFALTYNGDRGLYLMEEVTRAVMSEDGVAISEGQMTSEMDADGKAILYGVQFDVGSAVLRPSSDTSLDEIANVLRDCPGRFYIVGHTSDTGGFEINMRLSEARAQAIIDALGARYGIDTSRLQAAGVGPVAPLASNQNEAGRQLNRRVEVVERLEE